MQRLLPGNSRCWTLQQGIELLAWLAITHTGARVEIKNRETIYFAVRLIICKSVFMFKPPFFRNNVHLCFCSNIRLLALPTTFPPIFGFGGTVTMGIERGRGAEGRGRKEPLIRKAILKYHR
jgi:1-acyl-sn-glycerol-3-phosphate acyltransferase